MASNRRRRPKKERNGDRPGGRPTLPKIRVRYKTSIEAARERLRKHSLRPDHDVPIGTADLPVSLETRLSVPPVICMGDFLPPEAPHPILTPVLMAGLGSLDNRARRGSRAQLLAALLRERLPPLLFSAGSSQQLHDIGTGLLSLRSRDHNTSIPVLATGVRLVAEAGLRGDISNVQSSRPVENELRRFQTIDITSSLQAFELRVLELAASAAEPDANSARLTTDLEDLIQALTVTFPAHLKVRYSFMVGPSKTAGFNPWLDYLRSRSWQYNGVLGLAHGLTAVLVRRSQGVSGSQDNQPWVPGQFSASQTHLSGVVSDSHAQALHFLGRALRLGAPRELYVILHARLSAAAPGSGGLDELVSSWLQSQSEGQSHPSSDSLGQTKTLTTTFSRTVLRYHGLLS